MGAAAEGAKVAVVTIDPAKRLANSLGLEELGNEPRLIDPERFAGSIVTTATFAPSAAAPIASAAAVVVLPTPPEPAQTTMRRPSMRSATELR